MLSSDLSMMVLYIMGSGAPMQGLIGTSDHSSSIMRRHTRYLVISFNLVAPFVLPTVHDTVMLKSLIREWTSNHTHSKMWDEIHSQDSTAVPLTSGNW